MMIRIYALLAGLCLLLQAQSQPKQIILIGSDGLGAYAFEKADIPNIKRLMDNGTYTLKARSVLPSSSADNWMSMISGSPIELHGYTEWGSQTPEVPSSDIGPGGIYPTIFSLLEEQKPDVKKGLAYVWGGIGYLIEKDFVDLDFNGERGQVVDKALDFIINQEAYFTFIHFSEPDGAGHNIGHGTHEYYAAVSQVDKAIGRILDQLEESGRLDDTLIILSADHGGTGKGHGGKTLVEMEIPWIVSGAGVKARGEWPNTIITYDTGATLAYIMELEMPQSWRGQPQKGIFE